jgi:Tol biopolymer transport system component
MSLFEELKRRRVLRLVAAYVVVAWVLIQIVTAIEEPLNLPAWFDTAVIVLLGIGFPIAIIMSWVYDVTPDGVVREDGTTARPVRFDYGKIALGAVLLLGGTLLGNYLGGNLEPAPSATNDRAGAQVFEIGVPGHLIGIAESRRTTVITPDGSRVVISANADGQNRLFVRSLDSLDLVPIAGTDSARGHFAVSPDSNSVAFFSTDDGFLKTVPLDGGITTPLAYISLRQEQRVNHITWGEDGNIVFTTGSYPGLRRVPSVGGAPVTHSAPDGASGHKHPSYIPGSDWLVFVVGESNIAVSRDQSDIIALMSPDGDIKMTSLNGSSPRVTSDGHLLYFRRNAIWSVAIDLDNMIVTGDPVPIVEDIFYFGFAHFDVSTEGSLVYTRDSSLSANSLVWVDRSGFEEPTSIDSARYSFPGVSPDGDLVAVVEASPYGADLWTHSLSRGESTRWTFDEGRETQPVWTSDGGTLYFESTARVDMFRVDIRGDGVVEQLTDTIEGRYPTAVLPDGRVIVDEWHGSTADGNNVGIIDPSVSSEMTYLMQSEYRESHPVLSPDGSLLAYMSDSNGTLEIYVRRFPIVDDEVIRVSLSGENWNPHWGASRQELFYWNRNDLMMYSVQISSEAELSAASPVPLFDTTPYEWGGATNHDYDPVRDRFLMVKKPLTDSAAYDIVLIQNWQELLERQVP